MKRHGSYPQGADRTEKSDKRKNNINIHHTKNTISAVISDNR